MPAPPAARRSPCAWSRSPRLVEAQQDGPAADTGDRRDLEAHAPRQLGWDAKRPRHRGFDGRDVTDGDDDAVVQRLVAERGDAVRHHFQALPARRREAAFPAPAGDDVGREVGERAPFPLAVVDLDQAVVDLDRPVARGGDGRGRVAGAAERAGDDARDVEAGERLGQAVGLGLPAVGERSVTPPEEEPGPVRWCLAVPYERDHGDAGARSRPDRRKSSRRLRSARPKRYTIHAHAARPASSSSTTIPAAGRSAPSGSEAPVNGHQNTSVFAHAAESTRPQNAPMGRHSRRRRSRRGRPIVSSMTATSNATLPSSEWPYARPRNGRSTASGNSEPATTR